MMRYWRISDALFDILWRHIYSDDVRTATSGFDFWP